MIEFQVTVTVLLMGMCQVRCQKGTAVSPELAQDIFLPAGGMDFLLCPGHSSGLCYLKKKPATLVMFCAFAD